MNNKNSRLILMVIIFKSYTLILNKLALQNRKKQPLKLNILCISSIQVLQVSMIYIFTSKKKLVDILLFGEEGENFLEMKLKHFSERKKKRHIHLVSRNHKNLVESTPSIESLGNRNCQNNSFCSICYLHFLSIWSP